MVAVAAGLAGGWHVVAAVARDGALGVADVRVQHGVPTDVAGVAEAREWERRLEGLWRDLAARAVGHGEQGALPPDAVLRGVDVVALAGDAVGGALGGVVLPDGFPRGGGVARLVEQAAQVAGRQDDVVVPRAVELVEPEARPLPVEPVGRFRVLVGVAVGAAVGVVLDAGAVPEAERAAPILSEHVGQHGPPADASFPGGLADHDGVVGVFARLVEDAAHAVARCDEVVVDEELALGVDLHRPVGDVHGEHQPLGVEDAPGLGESRAVNLARRAVHRDGYVSLTHRSPPPSP